MQKIFPQVKVHHVRELGPAQAVGQIRQLEGTICWRECQVENTYNSVGIVLLTELRPN
jgi:hypothetical protein